MILLAGTQVDPLLQSHLSEFRHIHSGLLAVTRCDNISLNAHYGSPTSNTTRIVRIQPVSCGTLKCGSQAAQTPQTV